MKPNFILQLSHSGICLRRVNDGKTQMVGEVSLSDPEFDSKVAALRNGVAEKSDTPIATELRIPDSEILFTTVDDPEFDAKTAKGSRTELREKAVRDALEGMTPYALNDLNFIWKVKGKSELSIAAVARETLAEAEEFAASRGFNPVQFAARPGKAKFPGTAEFGATALQRKRDVAEAAEAAALKEAQAAEKAAAAALEKSRTPPPTPAESEPLPAEPETDTGTASAPTTDSAPATAKPDAAPAKAEAATTTDVAPPGKAAKPAPLAKAPEKAPLPAPEKPQAKPQPDAKPHPPKMSADAPRVGFSQPRINDPLPPLDDDGPADDVPPMPVSFATRRKQQADAKGKSATGPLTPGAAADPLDKDSRFGRIAARFAVTPENTVTAKGTVPPPPPRRAAPNGAKSGATPVLRGSAKKKSDKARVTPVVGLPDTSEAAASLTPVSDSNGKLLSEPDRDAVSARMASGRKLAEAEAMTVFGARDNGDTRSLKPLLIAVAVAAVLAMGVWAAFLLFGNAQISDAGEPVLPDTANALAPLSPVEHTPPAPTESQAVVVPAPAEPVVPPPTAGTDIADLPDDNGTVASADVPSDRASAPDSTVAMLDPQAPVPPAPETLPISPTAPEPISRDPLQRPPTVGGDENILGRYATTGIWIDTPTPPEVPATDRVDGLYVAAADPAINLESNANRPPLPEATTPGPLAQQMPPAPQGDGFTLDDRGLVVATPDGALSPDGILITAGRPARVPPTMPERPATLAPDPATQPDLPRTRPRTRPGNGESDQAQLNSPAIASTQEAGLQPRPRPETATVTPDDTAPGTPETIQDRAVTAALDVAGASTADLQAPTSTRAPRAPPAELIALRRAAPDPVDEEADNEPDEPISPYAVARSRLPKTKPGNFARTVETARATAAAAPQPQAVTRVAAASAVVTPRLPSSASVAKQATVKNAINLGKVNLIGVYGSSSNRRALVRLPSGKFVKVKVGDRVDGGRVAAIGQSQLSYTKRGRNVTLSMPNG